jgi:hypothetical protein
MRISKSSHESDRKIWDTIKDLKEDDLLSGYEFFPLLLRYPLSKVLGRVKRLELDSVEEKAFEYWSLQELQFNTSQSLNYNTSYGNKRKNVSNRFLRKARKILRDSHEKNFPINKVFIPVYSDRIEEICSELSRQETLIIAEKESPANFEHLAYPYKNKLKSYSVSREKIIVVYNRLTNYLNNNGYRLDNFSQRTLFEAVDTIFKDIQYVKDVYEKLSPKLILLFKDTYSPYQTFSLLAQRYNSKVILLQHGQDCETYFLDDVYTKNVIVWGEYRRDRYLRDSQFKAQFTVIGNPIYDNVFRIPLKKQFGKNWLLITRPHHSSFCYPYSRKVKEGYDILKVVAKVSENFKANLTIKPHPNDFKAPYQDFIKLQKNNSSIFLRNDSLKKIFEDIDLVISEDSSGIVDAMIYGKPVIVAHFANSEPTLPFNKFDAAPIVRNEKELENAVEKILSMDTGSVTKLQANQDKFIEYCAGPVGSNNTERIIKKIYSILEGLN